MKFELTELYKRTSDDHIYFITEKLRKTLEKFIGNSKDFLRIKEYNQSVT